MNAFKLLKDHLNNLNEDFKYQQQQLKNTENLSDSDYAIIVTKTLIDIEKYLLPYERCLEDYSIISPDYSLVDQDKEFEKSDLIMEELNYNFDDLKALLNQENLLNIDQKKIYNSIIQTLENEIENATQTVFFVDGPGGYGKTFLFNMLLAKVRLNNEIAIAVATSGIAALLLDGGRTAHSRFKIPIKITETSTLNISYNSELAELIRKTKLIIWDEAPMAHKFAFEAVDRTFRDLTKVDKPFGGIIIVFGGDFRQILPVVIRGTRGQIVDACLKRSHLWRHVNIMCLTINMRIQQSQDDEQKQFVDYLLQIGEGKESTHPELGEDIIELPENMIFKDEKIESLISEIFNNINDNFNDQKNYINYIKDRAILTVKMIMFIVLMSKLLMIFFLNNLKYSYQ